MAREKEERNNPRQPQAWQEKGYNMEENPCEWAPTIDDQNDLGYQEARVDGEWRDDPFGDDAVDEGLQDGRSEDVKQRESRFWVGRDKAPAEEVVQREDAARDEKKAKRWEKKKEWSALRKILTTMTLVVVLAVIGGGLFVHFHYQLREIRVIGNSRYSDEEVIRAAHLSLGMNLLFLNENSIRQGISEQGFMRLTGMRKVVPGTLELRIREREESAFFTYNGITCTLDDRGVVMRRNVQSEQEDGQDTRPGTEGLMHVEGFSIRYCQEGKTLELYNADQLTVYMEISLELRAMGLIDVVEILYVTDTDNLYLATRDGFSVRLGNSAAIHKKLRAMQLTLGKLHEMGKIGGTVDVSTPAEPTWIPEAGS